MKIFVAYSFEIELPEELVDSMPEERAKVLAMELAQNINFQEIQTANTKDGKTTIPVFITKVRSTRIEEW